VSHSDNAGVTNLGGWLTTVTSRICLDMLRSRKTRLAAVRAAPAVLTTRDPAREAMLADSIGAALVIVLERRDRAHHRPQRGGHAAAGQPRPPARPATRARRRRGARPS
jgi:DNA-directed RNA polymerase specialized sigma24 family protein